MLPILISMLMLGVCVAIPLPQLTLQGFSQPSQLFAAQPQQQPTLFVQTVQEETTGLQDPSHSAALIAHQDLSGAFGTGQTAGVQDFSGQLSQLRDPANPTADVFVHSGFPLQGVQLGGTSPAAQSPFQLSATPFARVSINSLNRGQQTVTAQPQQQFLSGNQFQANLQHQLAQQQQLQQLQQQQVQQQQFQHQQQQAQQPQFGQTFQTASGQTFTIPATAAQQPQPQQQPQQQFFIAANPQPQQQAQPQVTPLTGFRTVSSPITFLAQ